MRLTESIEIAADASAVWPFLADPALQGNWNPKCVSVDREGTGAVRAGERFEMVYRMSARDRLSHVEVVACEPPRRVVFQHRSIWKGQEQIAQEIYEIEKCESGVCVVQTIDMTRCRIAWPWRVLIWIINRFGRNAEEPYLERLKRLVESPS